MEGAIFLVPVSTLQRQKQQGGWAQVNLAVKCRTLVESNVFAKHAKGIGNRSLPADLVPDWPFGIPATWEQNPEQTSERQTLLYRRELYNLPWKQ
jgi:hypothetical protein